MRAPTRSALVDLRVARTHRADLTRLPKPTTGRVVVLLTALLAIGFVFGEQVHTTVLGGQFAASAESCSELFPAGPAPTDSGGFAQCHAPAERVRAAYLAFGAALVALGALIFIYLAPVYIWKRRQLKAFDSRLSQATARVAELAASSGLASAPLLAVSGGRNRDPFCFGRPGRTVMVIPRALAVRSNQILLFDPIIRHELAHVRHRDVPLAWLAQGFLLVAAAVAILPVLIGMATSDLSATGDYLWRAVMLVVGGWLAARAVLRAREHDADLVSARDGGREPLVAVLAGSGSSPAAPRWRQWIAQHPSHSQRVAVIQDPTRVASAGFIAGFLPALLTAAVAPALVTLTVAALTGLPTIATLVPAMAVAAISLGATVGVDLCRAATVDSLADGQSPVLRDAAVSAGVGLGVVLGQVVSPASSFSGLTAGVSPWLLLLSGLLAAGATVVVCGLVRSTSARRLPASVVVLISAVPFGLAMWAGQSLQVLGDLGPDAVRAQLAFGLASWPAAAVVLLAAVIAAWARSRQALPDIGIGIISGVAASAIFLLVGLVNAGPETDNDRLALAIFGIDQAAIAAVVTAFVLSLLGGVRGATAGGLAAPVAALTAVAVFTGSVVIPGGSADVPLVAGVLLPAVMIGTVGWLALAPVALFVGARTFGSRHYLGAALTAAGTIGLVAVAAGLGPLLVVDPSRIVLSAGGGAGANGSALGGNIIDRTATDLEAADYSTRLAPALSPQVDSLFKIVDSLAEQPVDPEVAVVFSQQVMPLSTELDRQVAVIEPREPAVTLVHAQLRVTLADLRAYLTGVIAYHQQGQPLLLLQALEHRRLAAEGYSRWLEGVESLG